MPRLRPNGGRNFPIVGLGASAGGLEALELFLAKVQPGSGMAFVVIQHLDPNHKGFMPELLQRVTSMKVMEAGHHMRVEPECVYIIPPNKDLALKHGAFFLSEPAEPRGRRLPIDFFFRALAEERHDKAVAVILSGMGSDGTLGLRAIKESGGLTLVQDPGSAQFDSMPRSAIDAGLADIVGDAEELPQKIATYVRSVPASDAIDGERKSPSQKGALEEIFMVLRSQTGHDFSLYKKSTVYRRIERRMGIHQLNRMADYVRYLKGNPQEVSLLFKELLIGVTNFFRDPQSWACLDKEILPALITANPAGKTMRAWVAGCSTGEEAYSLAILFKEVLERLKPKGRFSLQIFATDLDPDAIERARQGFYPANIAADVSAGRLSRFFVEEEGGYRICKDIREMVVFAPQNVIMDPPFTRLDILSCRNLLIYLGTELQKQLLPLFHYSLNPGGVLFLGSSESVGAFTSLFAPVSGKTRLFRRQEGAPVAGTVEFPSRLEPIPPAPPSPKEAVSSANLQALADSLLLRHFTPAAVLVNGAGDIVYINGRTGNYLEPAAGKANWNIYVMAREGLRYELAAALPKALRDGETIVHRNILVGGEGDARFIDLTVHPIDEPLALRGMAMIVFAPATTPSPEPSAAGKRRGLGDGRVAELEQALQHAQDEVRGARVEMQRSREELQAANEELQATNEELQSTNEELTSSKEEMQSMNEELQTLNAELQSKVDELSAASNDMKNLLNSTEIATVFLDGQLHVRRFTKQATRIFRLIPADAGRPLSDIVTDLAYPALEEDARDVLHTLIFCEKEISTVDGRWFTVRIMPYRTVDNVIDGVVITLSDISIAKHLEAELRNALASRPGKDGS